MYSQDRHYVNKILDLTSQDDEGAGEEGPGYICDHCELPMRKAEDDLLSTNKEVIVRQGHYFCKCGIIMDPSHQQQQLMKTVERSGPVIPKSDNDFFFESIPSNTDLKPNHHADQFDPEPNERERLEADGCTVLEERITTADGRTIIKR